MATPSLDLMDNQLATDAPIIIPVERAPTFNTGASARLRAGIQAVVKSVPTTRKGTYKHQPIDYNNDIRILRIQSGKDNEPLQCMLFPSALQASSGQSSSSTAKTWKYWALSYWWGNSNEEPSNRITIYKDTGARGATQTLNEFNKPKSFYIRDNLKAALLRFRKATVDVNVWVDALCINQEDKIEKNAQVARMHEVYTQAETVCVWLGEGDKDTKETFEFLKDILDLQKFDGLVKDKDKTAEKWAMVVQLMKNRWFSRRWVIQELALSRNAFVRWGDMDLWWPDFADAIALFMTKYEEIKRESLEPTYDDHKTTDARALGANTIVHATSNLFRKSHEGHVEQRLLPLEILVTSMLLAFEATEPRDTIFAVLMLAKDSHISSTDTDVKSDPRIAPDYDKCLLDVYVDFMDYCMDKSGSLDILCRYWAPVPKLADEEALEAGNSKVPDDEQMPSWIPLIKNSAFGEPHEIPAGRANGDSLVGGSERKGQQVYDASAGLRAWHEFGTFKLEDLQKAKIMKRFTFPLHRQTGSLGAAGASRPTVATTPTAPTPAPNPPPTKPAKKVPRPPKYDGTLYVRGFCLDVVKERSERVTGKGIVPGDALEMGGWQQRQRGSTPTVPDKLWRTLVADRGPSGTSTPGWYRRTCLECLQHTDRQGDLDIDNVKKKKDVSSTQITYLERVQPMVWGRRFFVMHGAQAQKRRSRLARRSSDAIFGPTLKLRSQEPLFGLGNSNVKINDLVCILFGCSVPVLLRKAKVGDHYEFIGECYVHGVMGGEAISGKPPVYPYNHIKYTTFELR